MAPRELVRLHPETPIALRPPAALSAPPNQSLATSTVPSAKCQLKMGNDSFEGPARPLARPVAPMLGAVGVDREPTYDIKSAFVELNGIEPSASSMPFRGELKKNQ